MSYLFSVVYSRAKLGMKAPLIKVETHLSSGLPSFSIVGLPETAVKESRDRVRSAIINSGFKFPTKRITVNLAPADLPKEGGRYDLPIALGILAASEQIDTNKLLNKEFAAELELSGKLRAIDGILPMALKTHNKNRTLVIAKNNGDEACLADDIKIIGCDNLKQVCFELSSKETNYFKSKKQKKFAKPKLDLKEVKGQFQAKKALEIAAAGNHHMLMIGPPGTGKSMLASRLPTILPKLNKEKALEVIAIQSISGLDFDLNEFGIPPFRSPHHNTSPAALIGGGSKPRPGEISLSHNGVLFLDELGEFSKNILDQLRQPLENGIINISRAKAQVSFPAKFQLIAAMNPLEGDKFNQFSNKISSPILDRIDIHIEVPKQSIDYMINQKQQSENSEQIRKRIELARNIQYKTRGKLNSELSVEDIDQYCKLDNAGIKIMSVSMEKFNLSSRSYHRILKLSRTIADLEDEIKILPKHLMQALSYRFLDRHNI